MARICLEKIYSPLKNRNHYMVLLFYFSFNGNAFKKCCNGRKRGNIVQLPVKLFKMSYRI